MAIIATDIKYYLSGGGPNSDPNASLGGAISTTEIVDATLHNLFDIVSSAEASAGSTEYRCIYVKNTHGSLELQNAIAYLVSNTPSTDTEFAFALGTSAVNVQEQGPVANELTAPAGVTWQTLTGSGNSQAIGGIPFGQFKAVWVRRVVSPGAAAYSGDNAVLRVEGDTAA